MLKSIIIDDELRSRESLRKMIDTFCPGVEVCAMCQNLAEAIIAIKKDKPDLVFLDIQMQRESGFDLFAKMESIDFDVIFTTAHSEYAIKAIKLSAIDYLLKPIDVDELKAAVSKVESKRSSDVGRRLQQLIENLNNTNPHKVKLSLPTIDGFTFIDIHDIMYCKASGNYTEIFLNDGSRHLVSRQLKEYDDLLSDHEFFRIHHSYLVNLNCVTNYVKGDGGHVVMSDNASLDVSRRKKDAFLSRIGFN